MATPAPGVRTVLLIDGNEDHRELYALALRSAGFRVLSDAQVSLTRERPDVVVVSDIDERGREGAARAREWTGGRVPNPPPVIALTSYGYGLPRQRIDTAGCASVLLMPVEPDRLVALVRRFVDATGPGLEPPARPHGDAAAVRRTRRK